MAKQFLPSSSVVTTKDQVGNILKSGSQTIKLIGSVTGSIVGNEVVYNVGASALTGTPYKVLVFDSLGNIITNSKLTFDNTLGAATDNIIQKLTTLERNAIVTPQTNFIIYNINTNTFQKYNGSSWVDIASTLSGLGYSVPVFDSLGSLISTSKLYYDNTLGAASDNIIQKLTTLERNAIVTPQTGFIIYNITDNKFQRYNGSIWVDISAASVVVGNPNRLAFFNNSGSLTDSLQLLYNDTSKTLSLGSTNTFTNGIENLIIGNTNTINTSSPGSSIFGSSNSMFGNNASSFITGYGNNLALNSTNCQIFGLSNTINGAQIGSTIFGVSNTIAANSCNYSFMAGRGNILSNATDCFIAGRGNSVQANSCVAFGNNNTISGQSGAIFGEQNILQNSHGIIAGQSNLLASTHSACFGQDNIAGSNYNHHMIFGLGLGGGSSSTSLTILGQYNEATTLIDNLLVVGCGSDNSNRDNAFKVKKTSASITSSAVVLMDEIQVKELNQSQGIAALVAGTANVVSNKVTANSRIYLTAQDIGSGIATMGHLYVVKSIGSFTINSSNANDTRNIAWLVINPGS